MGNPVHTFGICIFCNDYNKNRNEQYWIDKISFILDREEDEKLNADMIEIFKEK